MTRKMRNYTLPIENDKLVTLWGLLQDIPYTIFLDSWKLLINSLKASFVESKASHIDCLKKKNN